MKSAEELKKEKEVAKKELFKTQTKNVKFLKQVETMLIRDINAFLRKNDMLQVEIKTKLLALLYSATSEAQFLQILLTPNGFTDTEIRDINTAKQAEITKGWKKMIDLTMGKVKDNEVSEDLLNLKNKLYALVEEYIKKPSILRNKVAHGQWKFPLNSNNTAVNPDIFNIMNELNVVTLSKWSEVHQYMCFIIRDLVQSPRKGFDKRYENNLDGLDKFLEESESWTLEKRIIALKAKSVSLN
jgi:hypothetical protein